MARALQLFLLLSCLPALAEGPASEDVAGTTGMALCCRPAYWNCYEQCPMRKDQTDPGCLSKCETVHCVARSGTCAKGQGSSENSESGASQEEAGSSSGGPSGPGRNRPGPTGALHYDGKLTGAGTVHFEAYNLATDARTLRINGIIFGRLGVALKILKTTQVYTVIPGKPTQFSLEVSSREFEGWNRTMTQLTVAIGFADEAEKSRWRFENLLTQQDLAKARPGEFHVKGAFTPTASAK